MVTRGGSAWLSGHGCDSCQTPGQPDGDYVSADAAFPPGPCSSGCWSAAAVTRRVVNYRQREVPPIAAPEFETWAG